MNDMLHHLTYIEWRIGPAIIGIDSLEFDGENGQIDANSGQKLVVSRDFRCVCGKLCKYEISMVNGATYLYFCSKKACRRAVCVDCYEEAEWWTVYHRDCL